MTVQQYTYSASWKKNSNQVTAQNVHNWTQKHTMEFSFSVNSVICSLPNLKPSHQHSYPTCGLFPFWNHNTFQQFRITLHTKLCQQFYIVQYIFPATMLYAQISTNLSHCIICWFILHISAWPNGHLHSTVFDPYPHVYFLLIAQGIQYTPKIWYVIYSDFSYSFSASPSIICWDATYKFHHLILYLLQFQP